MMQFGEENKGHIVNQTSCPNPCLIYTQSKTVSIIRQPTQSRGFHPLDFSNRGQTEYPY